MQFIQLVDGIPTGNAVTEENFRQCFTEFENKSITPDDALKKGFGIFYSEVKRSPFYYEVVEEGEIIEKNPNEWWQTWSYRDMTVEERAKKDADIEHNVRIDRDYRLKRTVDLLNPIYWDQISEEKKQEWIAFRKALLDVPQQAGFPRYVEWPDLPES